MPIEKHAREDPTADLPVREALPEDSSVGVEVDRVFHHEELGWLLFEFRKLGGPYTKPPYKWRDLLAIDESHPNRYWDRTGRTFVRLWELARELDGTLYLVTYSVRETDTVADVPEDRIAQPFTRIAPDSGREEQVYYYVAAGKGAHVEEVVDVDTDADPDDPEAEPVETRPIEESRGGMAWEAFEEWFGRIHRTCEADALAV